MISERSEVWINANWLRSIRRLIVYILPTTVLQVSVDTTALDYNDVNACLHVGNVYFVIYVLSSNTTK
jgi:hypothetical protein